MKTEVTDMIHMPKMPVGLRSKVSAGPAGVLIYEFRLFDEAVATVGTGTNHRGKRWATVYSSEATNDDVHMVLLRAIKTLFTANKFNFAYSFADNSPLKGILYRLGIPEREKYVRIYDRRKEVARGEED